MECRKHLTVIGYHFCRQLAVRILEFLEGRDVSKCPYEQKQCENQCYRGRNDYPKPFHALFSGILSHQFL